jgi:cytosine/adenosine deaminase-related metal-dependent hydrolase
VLPISGPPLRDAWVAIEDGRIVSRGPDASDPPAPSDAREVDLGRVAVLPGLVNAHTHLELSHLAGQIPSGPTFVSWIRAVMAARRAYPDADAPEILASIDRGITDAVRCGTAIVGDIANTPASFLPLVASPLAGIVFFELIGFNPPDAAAVVDRAVEMLRSIAVAQDLSPALHAPVRGSLAAHAPYSVAPSVFHAIREAIDRHQLGPCSVHLAESAEESLFVRTGEGPWRVLLDEVGVWNPSWTPSGVGPVEYLDQQRFLGKGVLAVHGVQMSSADLARLAAHGATLVTCPRSNQFTGAGRPPIDAFYQSGVDVAVGTDSLASTPDLNVFTELAAMRALASSVPASRLLDSATRAGARALGFAADYGTIDVGKRARLLAVDIPPRVDDVEEYLVSGIHPEQVRWIDEEMKIGD